MAAPKGETDLHKMLKSLKPILHPGIFVFTSISIKDRNLIPNEEIQCEFKEKEGISLVLEKKFADKYNFVKYDFTCSWIQLEVHSSLEAVGLTAAFSNALANAGLSCNVIAGFYHDHIFVQDDKTNEAMEVLHKMKDQ